MRRSPSRFFLLVFALSVPFWVVGAAAANRSIEMPFNLPVSALMLVCPTIAAAILVRREEGHGSVVRLLRRTLDVRRVTRWRWYLPALLLVPLIYLVSYQVLRLLGRPLPRWEAPLAALPLLAIVLFVVAAAEELGWMGYAIGPLQRRWSALAAALLLGLVWAVWHVIPDLQNGQTPAWIWWQRLYTLALRVLIVWIFNNTGGSVFAATIVHTTENLGYAASSSAYDPAVTAVVTTVAAVIVTLGWGARTLTRNGLRPST